MDFIRVDFFPAEMGKTFLGGYPPSPRVFGIMDLAENLEKIYGAEQLTGKILSPKELGPRFVVKELRACS